MDYNLFWMKDGKRVPTRLGRIDDTGMATVRSPDPYDTGEIEYTVKAELLQLAEPTHTFVHSSMAGSYTTECCVLGQLSTLDGSDGKVTVLYIDPVLAAPEYLELSSDELETIATCEGNYAARQQLMKFYNVSTVDDLVDAMEAHILRLQAKLEASKSPRQRMEEELLVRAVRIG